MRRIIYLTLFAGLIIFSACKKSSEDLQFPKISEYYPLITGKYITYQLDSTLYVNFGQTEVVKTYQVKLQVDAQITDALGRPAFRIIRYIRKTAANPWVPDNTFMAVPTEHSMEFIENNLRYIKMEDVIKEGFSWKGNSYIDTYINYQYLDDWDYTYDSLNMPAKLGALTVDSTVKVAQRDDTNGNPADTHAYSERNLSEEKYAKGIGLVYRNFLHWVYQPPVNGVPGFKDGYGVKLTMIDHN